MDIYIVLSPLRHDGVDYMENDILRLTPEAAAQAVELGALLKSIPPDPLPIQDPPVPIQDPPDKAKK